MSKSAEPRKTREERMEDNRVCEMCGKEVEAGIIGMSVHIEEEHTQEEIVKEVSHSWTPHEPKVFHLPDGATHFIKSGENDLVRTVCGNEIWSTDVDLDEEETLLDLCDYEHVDPDEYCGNCVSTREYYNRTLPEPLEDDSE